MRTSPPAPSKPSPFAVEELYWDDPVTVHAESRPATDQEGRGFLLRLHTDDACTNRLAPGSKLFAKTYDTARSEALCRTCAADLVAQSHSSVVRHLRDAERVLQSLKARAHGEPMPREIVHCRALRHEAECVASIHPMTAELVERVIGLAGEVADALRSTLAAYDQR